MNEIEKTIKDAVEQTTKMQFADVKIFAPNPVRDSSLSGTKNTKMGEADMKRTGMKICKCETPQIELAIFSQSICFADYLGLVCRKCSIIQYLVSINDLYKMLDKNKKK